MSRVGRAGINDRMAARSPRRSDGSILPIMAEAEARSILYRLIEAGQLVRRALLAPLLERGLQPGDDAVLFDLGDRPGSTEAELAADLGVDAVALRQRIARLIERDLVNRGAAGSPDLPPGLTLTEQGRLVRQLLSEHWSELETALLGELPRKKRKRLRRTLTRFIDLLRL